jgi:hypothetical protein
MLVPLAEIHWIAVIAGTLSFAVFGAIYFMVLVPKQYLYVTGRENQPKEQQQAPGAVYVVGPVLCSLFVVIADAYLIAALGITSLADALAFSLVVALGFLVPITFNIAINPLFPRPLQYGLLNAPYFVVANLVAVALLVVLPI